MPTATRFQIFDGHNDSLLEQLMPHDGVLRSFFEENTGSQVDLPRLRKGGVVGGMFAMFVPPEGGRLKPDKEDLVLTADGYRVIPQPPVPNAYAVQITGQMLDLAERLVAESNNALAIATDIDSLRANIERDVVSMILHFEGAEAIWTDLANLPDYYNRGLRSLGPVWSRDNAFGHGVPFCYPSTPDTGPGLTEAGRELVKACNSLGIVLDLAHLNEKGFWDVARLTDRPLVVSHAAANALTRTSRNLTDKQLAAIGESDGVVGLNFCISDLHPTGQNDKTLPLSRLVEHLAYIADLIGVEHVAFGSDYDGATISEAIPDVSYFPIITDALQRAGFDDHSIRLIASENWLRVLTKTWQ